MMALVDPRPLSDLEAALDPEPEADPQGPPTWAILPPMLVVAVILAIVWCSI